ncbi:MAG: YcxB family protein [Blastocatellales bacterium]
MSDQIRFFLNWQEYFGAQEFLRASRDLIAPEKVVGGLLAVSSALWYFFSDLNPAAYGGLALGLVIIFGVPAIRRWRAKHKWEREPLYHTEHTLSFSEEGIFLQMGNIESNLTWRYYRSVLESPDGFLLISGEDAFNFFPKRAFDSENMINQFRLLAWKNLNRALTQ